eukprot:scpid14100/ scgid4532/ CUB and sushi domain-containing protein 2; CUB and sushi multiple domains protein 2
MSHLLSVRVKCGRLQAAAGGGKSSGYNTLLSLSISGVEALTRPLSGTTPLWGQELNFNVQSPLEVLQVTLFNKGWFSKDALGQRTISLHDISFGEQNVEGRWYELLQPTPNGEEKTGHQVLLELHYDVEPGLSAKEVARHWKLEYIRAGGTEPVDPGSSEEQDWSGEEDEEDDGGEEEESGGSYGDEEDDGEGYTDDVEDGEEGERDGEYPYEDDGDVEYDEHGLAEDEREESDANSMNGALESNHAASKSLPIPHHAGSLTRRMRAGQAASLSNPQIIEPEVDFEAGSSASCQSENDCSSTSREQPAAAAASNSVSTLPRLSSQRRPKFASHGDLGTTSPPLTSPQDSISTTDVAVEVSEEPGDEYGDADSGGSATAATATATAGTTVSDAVTTTTATMPVSSQMLSACSEPDGPENGSFVPASGPFHIGAVVRYRCNAGHILTGRSGRVCTELGPLGINSAVPSTPHPSALKPVLDSPYVNTSSNASSATGGGGAGEAGPVTAAPPVGRWSGRAPRCIEPSCGDPGAPENGYRVAAGAGGMFIYSSLVMWGCRQGYVIVGQSISRCVNNGRDTVWDKPVPQCKPLECSGPSAPANARVIFDRTRSPSSGLYKFGDAVRVQCLDSYGFVEPALFGRDSALMRCGREGTWEHFKVKCERIKCPDISTLNQVGYYRTSLLFPSAGSSITFGCLADFELRGSVYRVCRKNGTWSGRPTSCERLTCSKLDHPAHGEWSRLQTYSGSSVRLTCTTGYTLMGTGVLTCASDQKWYGSPSECVDGYRFYPPTVTTPQQRTDNGSTQGGAATPLNIDFKHNPVVFSSPMTIVIAVGTGIILLLLVIVGIMWLRRWRRRRLLQSPKDEKSDTSSSASIQYNPGAFDCDKTMISMLSRGMGSSDSDGANTLPVMDQPYKTSTLNTVIESDETSQATSDRLQPPRSNSPVPSPSKSESIYDKLADSRHGSNAVDLKQMVGRLAFAPMTDDEKEIVLATPNELEYDIPVLESCDESDDHNIYDDTVAMPNLYSEAHCHVHIYDTTDLQHGGGDGELDPYAYNGVDGDEVHEHPDTWYSTPPDLDEIYTDLAEDIAQINARSTTDTADPELPVRNITQSSNAAAAFHPQPAPLSSAPQPSALEHRPSKKSRRNSKAKSMMVTDSFRRILQNKRRRISVGSSYESAMQPSDSFTWVREPDKQQPTAARQAANEPEEHRVTFDSSKVILASSNSEYHQPIDSINIPVPPESKESPQHYYRQPVDSLPRGMAPKDCLQQAGSPGFPPPPPPVDLIPVESNLAASNPGLEYSSSAIVGPNKPPRVLKNTGLVKRRQSQSRISTSRSTASRPMSLPIGPASSVVIVKSENRKSKPVVAAKPRTALKPPHLTAGNRVAPKQSVLVAESGDVYRLPSKHHAAA